MIKLVIFDMDGVLVDACEWHRVALNEALKLVCNVEISLEDHYRDYNGLPTNVKLRKLALKNIISEEDIIRIEEEKQRITIDLIEMHGKPRQEKIDLMKFLKQKNIKIGCYTNSIRMTTNLMLKKTGIFDFFDIIITNQDVQNAKPDPEGYNKCMQILSIQKNECLIIEDSPKGLEAAKLSGAIVLKVDSPEDVKINLFEDKL